MSVSSSSSSAIDTSSTPTNNTFLLPRFGEKPNEERHESAVPQLVEIRDADEQNEHGDEELAGILPEDQGEGREENVPTLNWIPVLDHMRTVEYATDKEKDETLSVGDQVYCPYPEPGCGKFRQFQPPCQPTLLRLLNMSSHFKPSDMYWAKIESRRKLGADGPVVFSVSFPDGDSLSEAFSRNMLTVQDCEQLNQTGIHIECPPHPEEDGKDRTSKERSNSVEAKNKSTASFETIWNARCGICANCVSKSCNCCAFCVAGGQRSVMCIRKVRAIGAKGYAFPRCADTLVSSPSKDVL